MTMKISRRGSVVFLEGVVDENADFSPLLSESPPLQLNLSGISRINSIGVRSWMKFISLWGDKPMEYLECPTIITDQISITPVLMGLKKPVVKIMSGFISYVCSKCNQQEDLRVSRAQALPIPVPAIVSPTCRACGADLAMINPDQLSIFRP
jgi:hypothetical protein